MSTSLSSSLPDGGAMVPVAPTRGHWRPLGIDSVTITSGPWAELQKLNADVMIAHCLEWIEREGWSGNFDGAAQGTLPESRRGREFSDSEIFKLLEAMAWELGRASDTDLESSYHSLVARVAAAQEPDGYLNTMFGRPGQGDRYSDLPWGHELYCYGHLIQASVARARTGHRDLLFEVGVRAADHVCEAFGPQGIQSVCGHPEIEPALVELFRVTGEQRYLDQARLFVDRRGHGVLGDIEFGPQYFQDDVPVREAEILDGHAVRAVYLAAGAVDLAVECDDDQLLGAVRGQVLRTLARRTYLSGGIGAHHEGESFGKDYELPSDRAYSETCAAIGSIMVNERLLLATGEAFHADAIERALFNVVASSPALDGRSFFYSNTLHQRTLGQVPSADQASPRASSSLRAPWFSVSCCPNNVTRTVASLGAYLASVDDGGLQIHQYAGARIDAEVPGVGHVRLRVETDYPASGTVRVHIDEAPEDEWELTLRVPSWADGATLGVVSGSVDSGSQACRPGYVSVRRRFLPGDVVTLSLPLAPRWTVADARIDALRGQVAVERGPVVYCVESVGGIADVADVRVDVSVAPLDGDGVVTVKAWLEESGPDDGMWPYGAPDPELGGRGESPSSGTRDVDLIPLARWGNRGPVTMRVWMPIGS